MEQDPHYTNEELSQKRERFDAMPLEEQTAEISRLHEKAFLENTSTFYEDARSEENPELKEQLELAVQIAQAVKQEGGFVLIRGGYVRDKLLQKLGYHAKPKDIDIEVFRITLEKLYGILRKFGAPDTWGEQFAVVVLNGLEIALPRRDSATGGGGHRDIEAKSDPGMSVKEAGRRRDFTVNALALDPFTGKIIDEWGGIEDAKKRVLRAVDETTFVEDPLRVLRGARFAGQLGFTIDPETVRICRDVDLSKLPKERLGGEWTKLLLQSPKPSVGLEAARDLRIIEKLHPELARLIETPQDPRWHPEGSVWTHTCMVVDAASELAQEKNLSKEEALLNLLSALCHDLGKPATTVTETDGRITSKGHSEAGLEPAKTFLEKINAPQAYIKKILPLVNEHLFPSLNRQAGAPAVRKLARRLHPATIQELVYVGYADHKGRGTSWDGYPEGEELLEKAKELTIAESKPIPLLMGRHLIELGMEPGKSFGDILKEVFRLQLEGDIQTLEEAKDYALQLNVLKKAE